MILNNVVLFVIMNSFLDDMRKNLFLKIRKKLLVRFISCDSVKFLVDIETLKSKFWLLFQISVEEPHRSPLILMTTTCTRITSYKYVLHLYEMKYSDTQHKTKDECRYPIQTTCKNR